MKLITWNIQWGRGVDGRVDLARIVETARAMADFDVICLQEVADNFPDLPGGDDSNQFATLARLLPGYAAIDGIALDRRDAGGRRKRFGNMILSRLPVHSVLRHVLPWPADAQHDSMPRLGLEVVVGASFGPVRVTTTHLEYYSGVQRMAQARRLRELHEEGCERSRLPTGQPRRDSYVIFEPTPHTSAAVLTGDFNFPPEAAEFTEIQAPLALGAPRYRDAWGLVHGDKPHDPTFCLHDHSWRDKPYCCDFIFVSEGLAVRSIEVDAATQASDHQPVLIEFAS